MDKEIKLGDNLGEDILTALKCCDILIPVLTAGYASSLWCLREFYYYSLLNKTNPQVQVIIPIWLESKDDIENEKAGKWIISLAEAIAYIRLSSGNYDDDVKKIITAVKEKARVL